MRSIDLNVDLGEGCGNDVALMDYATSVNIACGWHAGDALTMHTLSAAALSRGIAIGAHPAYPDREHFGRRSMDLPADELHAGIQYQVGALAGIVKALGGRLTHVKPHGALYNDAEQNVETAETIVRAVRDVDSSLAIYGLAGGQLVDSARRLGLKAVDEAFADRGYLPGGKLVPRSEQGALIHDIDEATARAVEIAANNRVKGRDGNWIAIRADTLCLHGDGPHAIEFATAIRSAIPISDRFLVN